MPRQTNINLKPVAYKKEDSGSKKDRKRAKLKEEDSKLAIVAAKHFKPANASSCDSNRSEAEDVNSQAKDSLGYADLSTTAVDISEPKNDEVEINQPESKVSDSDVVFDVSDPSTWPFPLTPIQRASLLCQNPVQNINDIALESGTRSFNKQYFTKVSHANETVPREWLMYSKKTNSIFCYACCLFGSHPSSSSHFPFQNYGLMQKGYCDFVHQSRGIPLHESSQLHFQAVIKWKQYLKTSSSDKSLDFLGRKQAIKEISFWKDVLNGILDAIIFLAKNNLALRGSSNQIGEKNSGNFLSLIELLSKYHPPLALHVSRLTKNKTNYMSDKIQNEFIGIAASSVRQQLIKQIKSRKFFSIMFDATPDISHQEQISEIIRTVSVSKARCKIEENFIAFIHFDEKSGQQITQAILHNLQKDGLDILNCRGQGYDNGSNMAGIYQGVQARIKEINPLATFVPCAAHSLNLVGQNAACKSLQSKLVLGQIQNTFVFFSGSPIRWSILKSHTKISLKGHSGTRWSSRADAVISLFEEFDGVVEALLEISNSTSMNAQSVADALAQFNLIYNFKFLLGLVIWDFVLSRIQVTNLALQKKDIHIEEASKHLQGLVDWLQNFQLNGFTRSLKKATDKANDIGIDLTSGFGYRTTRNLKPLKYRTEETSSVTKPDANTSNIDKFKTEFFDTLVRNLQQEFDTRFNSIKTAATDFSFLWGVRLLKEKEEDLIKYAKDLAIKYESDIAGGNFLREMEHLRSALVPFLEETKSLADLGPMEVLNILTINGLQEPFINTHTALRIFLTLPVTVASNERSFSKLKIIKNHIRSSMGQERLSDLSIIAIERDYVENMSFDKVIDDFATAKCRRVNI